jgi:drug/metabolite transporter (DMT)-like permease
MRRFYIVGFLVLMAFDTVAQVCFKFAAMHALPLDFSAQWIGRIFGRPWIYVAVAGCIGAFITWMSLLRHASIGPAFAASHLEFVSVMLLSVFLFDERIGPFRLFGALLIVAGIVCLAFSETGEQATEAAKLAKTAPGSSDAPGAQAS